MKKSIILMLASLFCVSAFAKDTNLLLKENFKIQDINNIDVKLSSEKLRISPIYGDEISIEVHANNRSTVPTVIANKNNLSIEGSHFRHFGFIDYCDVDVFIPYDAEFESVSISLSSAKIEVQRLTADSINIKCSSGSVELSDIDAGDLQVSTSSGNIRVNTFTGEYISTKSSSGSVKARDISCDYFDAKSASGSIEYELVEAPLASSELRSASGSITLSIPDTQGFDIIASSSSGNLRDYHTGNRISPRHQYRNSYYGGGSEISITTASGSITLEK